MNETFDNCWAIIKNPTSGFRSMKKDQQIVFDRMSDARIEYTLYETEFAGHAIELTRQLLKKGFRKLLVVGGDGTLNEVVNGIMTSGVCDTRDVTLALLPHGTGNDWGRYWGMKRGKTDIVKIISEGRVVTVDVGKLMFQSAGDQYSRYFLNGLGFGLDAKVCYFTNKLKDVFGGHHWLYTVALLLSVFTHRIRRCTISDSNGTKIDVPLFSAAIGNACYSGGGLKQTDGNPTDGVLFATIIQKLAFMDIFAGLKALFAKRLWEAPFCTPFCTDHLHITTARSLLFEMDGVMVDGREFTRQTGKEITDYDVYIEPEKINMLVP